jgi:hypothetical protein
MSDLDQLKNEAVAIDQVSNGEMTQGQGEGLGQSDEVVSLNVAVKPMIIQFMGFGVGFVEQKYPFTGQYYNQVAIENIANAMIKVADKKGFDLNKVFGDPDSDWGVWIQLAMAVGIPTFGFYMAVKEAKKPAEPEVPTVETPVDITSAHENIRAGGFHG